MYDQHDPEHFGEFGYDGYDYEGMSRAEFNAWMAEMEGR